MNWRQDRDKPLPHRVSLPHRGVGRDAALAGADFVDAPLRNADGLGHAVLRGWWAANRPAAPGAVRRDLEAAFALLVEQPGMATVYAQSGWRSSPSGIQAAVPARRYGVRTQ